MKSIEKDRFHQAVITLLSLATLGACGVKVEGTSSQRPTPKITQYETYTGSSNSTTTQ